MPVGFKWFVPGLIDGSLVFGGEESAGASFLRTDGSVWSTDKDGIILALLASEITAVTGKTPSVRYRELEERHRQPRVRAHRRPGQSRERRRYWPSCRRIRCTRTASPASRSPNG